MAQRDGDLTARDGATIHYSLRTAGADAPNVVLIHSLGLDRSVWYSVAERLANEANVLIYDCRGHGVSTKGPGPYDPVVFANDLAELMKSIGWTGAIVGGASMGGTIALAFAASYPGLVQGLALIDTTAWYNAPQAWDDRAKKAETDGLESMIAFQVTRWFSDAFRESHKDIVDRANGLFLKNDIPSYAATCRMLGAFDGRADLSKIKVPTEVLVGEEDYATPPDMARQLEGAIAGAHLTIVPGARHLTMIEIPDEVTTAIRATITRAKDTAVANRR